MHHRPDLMFLLRANKQGHAQTQSAERPCKKIYIYQLTERNYCGSPVLAAVFLCYRLLYFYSLLLLPPCLPASSSH